MKLRYALVATALAVAAPAHAASVFAFDFDNQGLVPGDGPLVQPSVGSGYFVSPVDLAPGGTYNLASLPGFSFKFSFFNGQTYSTGDIVTPLTGLAVRIEQAPAGFQRLFFTESGAAGSNGGPLSGALDLFNGTNYLSFEPTLAGGNFLYLQISAGPSYSGRYQATGVPEPATWAMMLVGFGFVGFAIRRQRRCAQVRVGVAYS